MCRFSLQKLSLNINDTLLLTFSLHFTHSRMTTFSSSMAPPVPTRLSASTALAFSTTGDGLSVRAPFHLVCLLLMATMPACLHLIIQQLPTLGTSGGKAWQNNTWCQSVKLAGDMSFFPIMSLWDVGCGANFLRKNIFHNTSGGCRFFFLA